MQIIGQIANKPTCKQIRTVWVFLIFLGISQTGTVHAEMQWAGMKGTMKSGMSAIYGTKGVSDPANRPSARQDAVSWTDASGSFWLFGGEGFDSQGDGGLINDMWKYDKHTGNWTWMKGDSTVFRSGKYGTLGVPAVTNTPGARYEAASCTASGALWLFGGHGYAGNPGDLNDLWKYDLGSGNWIWMKGAKTENQVGTYGTRGVEDVANTPGARQEAVCWSDPSGAVWLFGGHTSGGPYGSFNDLWKFDPASGNWTWMKGSSTVNQAGTFGTLGVADAANTPGARFDAVTWADSSGALWLFGGYGRDSAGVLDDLNDLWRYDPVSGNWTWMKGASVGRQQGTYGTLGVDAPSNTPGARSDAVTWTDSSGALWLFGGVGRDGEGKSGLLNDLWKYNPATGNWTWMKGASTRYMPGIYGTQGIEAAANTPSVRCGAVSWTDAAGELWLLGGQGHDNKWGPFTPVNDMWKFNTGSGNWTWMKGPSSAFQSGSYGTLGIPDEGNIPGARTYAAAWTGSSNVLWLFGGQGRDSAGSYGYLNDLWNYDPSSGKWTWIKGDSVGRMPGTYGTMGIADQANTPGARLGAVSWTDDSDALWLFGGYSGADHNDLWRYAPDSGDWTWMKGASSGNQSGNYGTIGVSALANTPGARCKAATWTDDSGTLWLFGGSRGGTSTDGPYFNDLWKYDPSSGNWTWMKGSSATNAFGTYGTRGVADPANTPGARNEAVTWTDASGTLWLFGGYQWYWVGGWHNDLWKYDTVSGNWTWVKGSSTPNSSGNYGVLGVPRDLNTPGARSGAFSWTDDSGALWLFGGYGYAKGTTRGRLNDLWKYDPEIGTWTWMKGPSTFDQTGVCNTLGVADSANNPGARVSGASWTDHSGAFWLFGGAGFDCELFWTDLGDLWRLTLSVETGTDLWDRYR